MVAYVATYADALAEGRKIDQSVVDDANKNFLYTSAVTVGTTLFNDLVVKNLKNAYTTHKNSADYAKAGIGSTEQVDYLNENRSVHTSPSSACEYYYGQERSTYRTYNALSIAADATNATTEEMAPLIISQWAAELSNGGCED